MGGDHAPSVVVEGAVRALNTSNGDLEVVLVGQEGAVRAAMEGVGHGASTVLHLLDAPEVIGMGEAPASAVKTKRSSSIHLGLSALKQGHAQGFVSAGNTGAVMAASLFILGRLEGVSRPSVIGFFPTTTSYCIVLDVGTNVDCRPEHLLQFAKMGTVYANAVMKRENPSVALLNVGEEPGKGNDLVKAAFELLEQAPDLNFRGNVEGRDLLHHAADVVVCDGFVGNVLLKFGESVASAFPHMIAEEIGRRQLSGADTQVVLDLLSAVRRRFNYEEYGGAPLLGVDGNVIIGHGGSSARAVERMILMAADEAREGVVGAIAASIGT